MRVGDLETAAQSRLADAALSKARRRLIPFLFVLYLVAYFDRINVGFASLQMNDFRDVLGAKMSTGMRQKVSIARAIVHDPPIMIFDEPPLGLDVLVARAVLKNIERLRDRRRPAGAS